jgi:hypothetical protein
MRQQDGWVNLGEDEMKKMLLAATLAAFSLAAPANAQTPQPGTVVTSGPFGQTITVVDACQALVKTSVAVSQAANARLITAVAGKKTYVCSVNVTAADAENVSLVEGTGSTCGTGTAAVIGGATAANGPNLIAGGAVALGSGGYTVANTVGSTDVCLFQSGSGRVAGVLTYVQQ